MPVACPVAVAQQAPYERTPFSTEAAGKLNYCLGGGNPLLELLVERSPLAPPCHWSCGLGTSTVQVMPGLLPCPCQLSFPFHPTHFAPTAVKWPYANFSL